MHQRALPARKQGDRCIPRIRPHAAHRSLLPLQTLAVISSRVPTTILLSFIVQDPGTIDSSTGLGQRKRACVEAAQRTLSRSRQATAATSLRTRADTHFVVVFLYLDSHITIFLFLQLLLLWGSEVQLSMDDSVAPVQASLRRYFVAMTPTTHSSISLH
jgi:hypothetical protein